MKHSRKAVLFFALAIFLYGALKPLRAGAWGLGLLFPKEPVAVKITPIMKGLANCESGGNPKAINWEDGGSPSYGKYQYKLGTFRRFVRELGMFPETEDAELMNIIMDGEVQDSVTKKVLEDPHNWPHWTNCMKMLGYM